MKQKEAEHIHKNYEERMKRHRKKRKGSEVKTIEQVETTPALQQRKRVPKDLWRYKSLLCKINEIKEKQDKKQIHNKKFNNKVFKEIIKQDRNSNRVDKDSSELKQAGSNKVRRQKSH